MFNPFMSKEKKAMRTKMALRRGVNDLRRWDRSLEKKKGEMMELGRKAKEQGSKEQFRLATSGLKMIMAQQLRSRRMQTQLQLVENMHELSSISGNFVGLMGKVGSQITKITGRTDFMKNPAKLQEGLLSMETMMQEMESFLGDTDDSLTSFEEQGVTDSEIEKLFDLPGQATQESIDISDIEAKLHQELNNQ